MPEPTLLPVSRTLADWDAPLSHDLATVFRAFAEAPDRIAATAADLSWELVARRVPDAATIAWLLLRRALTAALGEALANARLRPAGNKLDEAPANAAAQTVAIPADFLDDPATLPIVPLATDLLRQFASAHGLTPGLAGAVADRLPALFARRVYDERALASRELAPLQEAIGGRWAEDPWERAWREARAGWQAAAQAPVGGSPLAIDCFRVPPQAKLRRLGDDQETEVRVDDELAAWLERPTVADTLRLLTGTLGAGRTAIATGLAAQPPAGVRVLLLTVDTEIRLDALLAYTVDDYKFPSSPLADDAPRHRLLLIIDDADGAAPCLVAELAEALAKHNRQGLWLQALLIGEPDGPLVGAMPDGTAVLDLAPATDWRERCWQNLRPLLPGLPEALPARLGPRPVDGLAATPAAMSLTALCATGLVPCPDGLLDLATVYTASQRAIAPVCAVSDLLQNIWEEADDRSGHANAIHPAYRQLAAAGALRDLLLEPFTDLLNWIDTCGPASPATRELTELLEALLRQSPAKEVVAAQQHHLTLLNEAIAGSLPLERCLPRLPFAEECRHARRVNLALLAALRACTAVTGQTASLVPAEAVGPWLTPLLAAASWLRTCLARLDLQGADLSGLALAGADFTGANLQQVRLVEAKLCGACFQGACLDHADLTGADLRDARFAEASLRDASLKGARLRGADWQRAHLERANFSGQDFSGETFDHAFLEGAVLQRTRFRDASLRNAHLEGADLRGADLTKARLTDTNLVGADLRDARLVDANLKGARLTGARLDNANLQGAILRKADVRETILDKR